MKQQCTNTVIFLFLCLLFVLVTHFLLSRLLFSFTPFSNSIQDIAILLNLIIILLMLFNTFVFQVGLVAILLERFRALLMLSALYLTFSIVLHSWLMNLRWLNSDRYIWTDGLQVLFVLQRTASVLYYYLYKRTTEYLGDPRLYEDSPWLREIFARARQ
uniref:transmembrane protein 138-like isoform X1 n=2 Tax=Scatophagus argus TaxID=75038 RepID=UPI001ED80A9D|nr:transmembrane protein 138-like isoform X1 [Scatophagus argus]